jgi:hypothetical protein
VNNADIDVPAVQASGSSELMDASAHGREFSRFRLCEVVVLLEVLKETGLTGLPVEGVAGFGPGHRGKVEFHDRRTPTEVRLGLFLGDTRASKVPLTSVSPDISDVETVSPAATQNWVRVGAFSIGQQQEGPTLRV